MTSLYESCIVSSPREGNHATTSSESATDNETSMQQLDLIALAMRVLAENQCNSSRNLTATKKLHPTNSNNKQLTETSDTKCSSCGR
jgi:hypothetical protein